MGNLTYFLVAFPAIIIALALHEYGHAAMATKMGDPTPRQQGRLTLNPLAHMDPMGTVFIIFTLLAGFGFGWGKPVMTDPRYYKKYRQGRVLVAVAGPAMNLCLAMFTISIAYALFTFQLLPAPFIHKFISIFIMINIVLMVFNMLPIPPLDGGHVLEMMLPWDLQAKFRRFAQFGMLILLGLMFFGVLRVIINFFFLILFESINFAFGEGFAQFLIEGLM